MNNNHKVEITVGVKDLATKSLQNVSKAATQMKNSFGNGSFLTSFNRNLESTIKTLDKLANSMYKFNMYTASIQRNLVNVGTVAAVGAGAVAAQGMNNTLDFDYNTRVMQSRMGVSDKARQDINKYILDTLNSQVGYGPNDLAKAGIILGQGGINSTDDMKSMLKTTSYFAEAVDANVETAAEMIISAAKGFDISLKDSSIITDKLAVALNQSLLHVEELPHAIGELAGRAKMYGQSFDSSLVALMTARDQGMSAAQASQDFLHGLRSLAKIGREDLLFPKTRQFYEELGVDTSFFNTETKQLKEFPEIIASLEQTMMNNGLMKNKDELAAIMAQNGGVLPEDFINKMSALPLISKVFGAAGMAPIVMGLQSKYEEVDADGNKTGNTYYGSEALKKRQELIANSGGEIQKTHDIIAESAKFQIEVAKGAWEGLQIKFLDNMTPVIKTGAEVLSDLLSGTVKDDYRTDEEKYQFGEGKVDAKMGLAEYFRRGVNNSAARFRDQGYTGTAEFVEGAGNFAISSAQVSTVIPPIFKRITEAFNENIVKADWGSNLIEFPWHLVENGVGFINDLLSANKSFEAAVAKLPQDLQDPAKLVQGLINGGLVLLVGGAIVKVIELSFRAASATLNAGKIALDLTGFIKNLFKGGGGDDGGGSILDKVLGKDKVINANVVNVVGKVVNMGGDGDFEVGGFGGDGKGSKGGKSGGKGASITKFIMQIVEDGIAGLKGGGATAGLAAITTAALIDIFSGVLGGPSLIKTIIEYFNGQKQAAMDEYYDKYVNPETRGAGIDRTTEIVPGHGYSSPEAAAAAQANKATQSFEPVVGAVKEGTQATTSMGSEVSTGVKSAASQQAAATTSSGQTVANGVVQSGAVISSANIALGENVRAGIDNTGAVVVTGINAVADQIGNIKFENNISITMPAPQVTINAINNAIAYTTSGKYQFNTNGAGGEQAQTDARRTGADR